MAYLYIVFIENERENIYLVKLFIFCYSFAVVAEEEAHVSFSQIQNYDFCLQISFLKTKSVLYIVHGKISN